MRVIRLVGWGAFKSIENKTSDMGQPDMASNTRQRAKRHGGGLKTKDSMRIKCNTILKNA